MSGKAATSAIRLIRTEITAKSSHRFGNFTPPFLFFCSKFHDFGHKDRRRSPIPAIDFSSINDITKFVHVKNDSSRGTTTNSYTALKGSKKKILGGQPPNPRNQGRDLSLLTL
ncbi:hypothetical protein ACS0TY_026260 [Phlomoides rotata]